MSLLGCLFVLFVSCYSLLAQTSITFAGVVVDEAGDPVIGAAVTAVEAGTSTLTNNDGQFTLTCTIGTGGTSLRVSYVGMTTVITGKYTSSTTNIRIVLNDDSHVLDNVQQKRMKLKK